MRALVCESLAGDFSGAGLRELAIPVPGPGQARVKVAAASLNFPDLLMLRGAYQHKPDLPFTLGMDLAGVVDAVGPGVESLAVGQRVAGGVRTGAFAQYAAVDASSLHVAPERMSFAEAAAYPAAYITAHVALIDRARLQPGETLLVHGASGGVGLAAIDVGRMLGARVLATTGSPDKAAALRDAGAEEVLPASGFRERVKELTGGNGADVILDAVGGDVFDESTRCIAFDGRLLVVGFAGGRIAAVATNIPLIKAFSVMGVRAGEYGRRYPERGKAARDAIWRWAAEGRTHPRVFAELPLDRWQDAFALMRDRKLVGKVVLTP